MTPLKWSQEGVKNNGITARTGSSPGMRKKIAQMIAPIMPPAALNRSEELTINALIETAQLEGLNGR